MADRRLARTQLERLHAEQERRYPRGDLEPLAAGVFDEVIAAIIASLESQSEPPPTAA